MQLQQLVHPRVVQNGTLVQDDAWKSGPMAGNIVGKVGNPQHGSFRGKTIYKGPGYAETENVPLIFPVIKLGIYWGYAVIFFLVVPSNYGCTRLRNHRFCMTWGTRNVLEKVANLKVTK